MESTQGKAIRTYSKIPKAVSCSSGNSFYIYLFISKLVVVIIKANLYLLFKKVKLKT